MGVLDFDDVLEFDGFRLDRRTGGLYRLDNAGHASPVAIGSRAMQILQLLVDHQGDLVSKQTIMDRVWPNTVVEESNVTTQISALRRLLDRDRTGGSCIQTVPGRGYRLVPRVYRVEGADIVVPERLAGEPPRPGQAVILPKRSDAAAGNPTSTYRRLTFMAGTFALLLILIALPLARRRDTIPANIPPRLSLAVLPFQNIGEDRIDDYLANGITEDLRSDLSHIPGSTVVGHASATRYRGTDIIPSRIGQALNVRYLIEGSIRRLGSTIRVNVQLLATDNGTTLWADRFDEDFVAVAAGQDRVVARMRSGLGISLVDVESVRSLRERPTAPDAFDLVLRARSLLNQPPSEERSNQALALYDQALALDADSVHALTGIALIHINKSMDQGRWLSPEAMQHAEDLLARASKIAPNSERVLVASAAMLRSQDRCEDLTEAAERLVKLFPNSTAGYNFLGWCKLTAGHAEEELPLLQKVIQIDPVSPSIAVWYQRMAQDLAHLRRDDEAIRMIGLALTANPDMRLEQRGNAYRILAITNARLGRLEQARYWLQEGNKIRPFDTVRRYHFHGFANDGIEEQMRSTRDALRLAGLRDHAEEDADFGLEPARELQKMLEGRTPTTVAGARTVHTREVLQLMAEQKPLVVDTGYYPTGHAIPTSVELKHSGLAGSLTDSMQGRLQRVMQSLTHDDLSMPIIVVGWNSERFDGPNLVLRLVHLGYRNVLWYRGGREAWEVNNLPQTEPVRTSW